MAAAISSSSSTILVLEIPGKKIHSRKLLLHIPNLHLSSTPQPSPVGNRYEPLERGYNSFDANVVMVLSVLSCAIIFSLALYSIIRFALRCLNNNSAARLANTGIKKKALKTFPIINYAADLKFPGLDSECAICLSEFAPGERVRVLPRCNHGFHVRCIDRWLSSHSSCPTCRHCLKETCEKIVGSTQASTSTSVPSAPPETIIKIAPLEPEGLVRSYQS